MRPVVFIPDPIARGGMAVLEPHCDCIAPWAQGNSPSTGELRAMLSSADAVIVRLFSIGPDDLASAPGLKVISKHGVGVDNIDVAAATARRVPVLFTPNANANAVAEHTLTLMLALARNLYPASAAVHAGRFQDRGKFAGIELAGKTLGIVGLGRIGRRVAEMAHRGFAMEVRAYDPFVAPSSCAEFIKLETAIDDLLGAADFISLHVPLTGETRQLIDTARLRLLKPNCRIINTSRGGVIDEVALAAALADGRLGGAALDVFEQEPLPVEHPLLQAPNILLTPHISSSTEESLARMARDAAQGVVDVLEGRRPEFPVNPEVLS